MFSPNSLNAKTTLVTVPEATIFENPTILPTIGTDDRNGFLAT